MSWKAPLQDEICCCEQLLHALAKRLPLGDVQLELRRVSPDEPTQPQRTNYRASGLVQVVVSKAREHTVLVQAHCPSRFRYNP